VYATICTCIITSTKQTDLDSGRVCRKQIRIRIRKCAYNYRSRGKSASWRWWHKWTQMDNGRRSIGIATSQLELEACALTVLDNIGRNETKSCCKWLSSIVLWSSLIVSLLFCLCVACWCVGIEDHWINRSMAQLCFIRHCLMSSTNTVPVDVATS